MKAVIANVPIDLIEARRKTGADRWDEMWEGVLHMPPMPNREHQALEGDLEYWLRMHWAIPQGNKVYHQINLALPGGWPDKNYRIPDLVLLTPDRFHIDRNEYFEGAPTAVVEIRSPDDEAYEKLPFYGELGVPEVWIINRDTRAPEVYSLAEDSYKVLPASSDGWIASAAIGVELKSIPINKVAFRIAGDESTYSELPLA